MVAFSAEPRLLGLLEVPVLLGVLCVSLSKYLTSLSHSLSPHPKPLPLRALGRRGSSGFGKLVWDPLQDAWIYFTVARNTRGEERKSCEMLVHKSILQSICLRKQCTRPTYSSQGEHVWRIISSIMQEEMQAAVWADTFFFFFPLWSFFRKGKRELETCYKLGSALCPLLLASQLLARDAQRKNTRTGQACRASALICHPRLQWPAPSRLQDWQVVFSCLVTHNRFTFHEFV